MMLAAERRQFHKQSALLADLNDITHGSATIRNDNHIGLPEKAFLLDEVPDALGTPFFLSGEQHSNHLTWEGSARLPRGANPIQY
jgi:hypothetical protein